MAYIRKVGDKWSAEIRSKGKSKSRRFANKKLAQQWALMMEASDNVAKSSKITLAEALSRYGREYSDKKKSFKNETNRIKKMMGWDIAQKRLDDITLQDLNKLRDDMLLRLSPAPTVIIAPAKQVAVAHNIFYIKNFKKASIAMIGAFLLYLGWLSG